MLTWVTVIVSTSLAELSAANDAESDLVSSLPYYTGNQVNFKTYSGYLEAHTGHLFYFFTESSNAPATDPLLLWLNGGPGCSSLMGAFIELGPYHPYDYGTSVEYNPFSWNTAANILFLESPPCVGFSYPKNMDCHTYTTNDTQTRWDNYMALQSFFQKFPQYSNHRFLIAGESYAGHYVPQLAALIIAQNERITNGAELTSEFKVIHLEGVALGNPYMDRDDNWFKGWIPTMYSSGIISEDMVQQLNSHACANGTYNAECAQWSDQFISDYLNDINVYDVTVPANCTTRSRQQSELLRQVYHSAAYDENLEEGNIWSYPYSACNEDDLVWYLGLPEVWDALHVNQEWMNSRGNNNNNTWRVCGFWNNNYDMNATDDATDQVSYVRSVLHSGVRVLVFSGNDDLVCPYASTRFWVYNKLNESDTGTPRTNWTKWHVNQGEVGGWYQQWERLTFMVVRDAGHEVPEYQPARALGVFLRFVANDYPQNMPLDIKHLEWINHEDYIGESADENTMEGKKGNYIAMGVLIGVFVVLVLILLMYGARWVKQKGFKERMAASQQQEMARVMLQDTQESGTIQEIAR